MAQIICDILSKQNDEFNRNDFLNFKKDDEIKSYSNREFYNNALFFACGLREMNIDPKSFIANFSYQNPTWLIVDFGAILSGMITVPIFHNISSHNLLFQIKDANIKVIFSDDLSLIDFPEIHQLDIKIIYLNKNDLAIKKFDEKKLIAFDDVILLGREAINQKKYSFKSLSNQINENDLATIIYTSGSTGNPKGVELTHKNLISQIEATEKFFPLKDNDIALSYLPLAHIFERMVMMYYISQGIKIYFIDDVKKISQYLHQIRPTLMTTVPRVLEKVYLGINNKIEESDFVKKIIGKLAIKKALTKNINYPKSFIDKIYDNLVYKKFRDVFGGRVNMIICGGAMISEDMERFFRNIGLAIYPGYGMTETSPVISANCPKAYRFRTVGKPFNNVEVRINQEKELEVKGPNIMKCYHNQPELTQKIISNDGWLKTGDLAEIDNDGFIKIIGRKKELFKSAYGKYIAPVPIEQKIVQDLGFLTGAIIIAESKQFTSALLFPDFELLAKLKNKLSYNDSDQNFLESSELKDYCQEKIEDINKKLDKWEKIVKFEVIKDNISIESGEITPSMKLKRSVLEKKYQDIINNLYS